MQGFLKEHKVPLFMEFFISVIKSDDFAMLFDMLKVSYTGFYLISSSLEVSGHPLEYMRRLYDERVALCNFMALLTA